MPRIVPLQLLKCLKVLLDDYGGILSAAEVTRIAGLMTKYSKKLVSKCIYVQILKCTRTELLDEFMGVGGWSLVHTWLSDSIRAMNWPLVQEILELLLLSPVDINRLKVNTAPKLVKGLCKDGGTEEVRILAKRLVDQWLKVVTENNATAAVASGSTAPSTTTMAAIAAEPTSTSLHSNNALQLPTKANTLTAQQLQKQKIIISKQRSNLVSEGMDKDPLADVDQGVSGSTLYTLTPAQKKANQSGLVYKIIMKDGQQVLAKVAKSVNPSMEEPEEDSVDVNEEDESDSIEADEIEPIEDESAIIEEEESEDAPSSLGKEYNETNDEVDAVNKIRISNDKKSSSDRKSSIEGEKYKSDSSSRDKDRKSEKDKDRKSKSSSSSSHKSSASGHKSSSSSSKGSSSSSSKSKSSSHHRSSSSSGDKHRSDKERSSSSKDRSSSSKHRSSSSKSSSTSKDRHRDKDKSSSSSKKDKDREQAEKDKDTLSKMIPPSLDKLGKIPKKAKPEGGETEANKVAQSITIPSKKASMSIEIRRDSEKVASVKTYKSQFRSHGLTEEAPPPPSRKGLKKPNSIPSPGTVIPKSLPSSLKRPSPPPRSSPTEKKSKIDINNVSVSNEKPGAIKLIAPKKIQTLVETNLFSDALSAATGPKRTTKRKRPAQSKDEPTTPSSPTSGKVTPLKFYQDTLDQSKLEEKSNKENQENGKDDTESNAENSAKDGKPEETPVEKDSIVDDDDDIPLKKVKEDIEQKVRKEQNAEKSGEIENEENKSCDSDDAVITEPKKPGPGCGPDGPPGVLMLHRRKGPKKKLTWRPQEQLEEIRFFELDETERVNVTKTSFMDMKNMERFSERDAINMSRRGLIHEDCMEPQIPWRPLVEVDDVPVHPDGNQSKQRKIQAEREMTTLRALYFSNAMIPDSPAEAEIEPVFGHDIPVIPLEDITGNPDAINDFTSMPWPESKGSPKHGENAMMGTGGLGGTPADMFNNVGSGNVSGMGEAIPGANNNAGVAPFNPFVNPFVGQGNVPHQQQMQIQMQQGVWQGPPPNGVNINNHALQLLGNHLNGQPNIEHHVAAMMGGIPPGSQQFGGPQFPPGGPPFGPAGFNGPNFRQMGPMGQMNPMMMMGNPMMNGPRNNNNNNRNNGNWRKNGGNFQDNPSGGPNNWRPAGTGLNRGAGGGVNMINNNGVCKAFMRGHCRLGKSCKYVHPKSKRI